MIYLDNASTTWPKPPEVLAAMTRFQEQNGANPGRGAYRMAMAASDQLRAVRAKITRLFDADAPERTILCLNCTDALNIAIKGVLREGDHVVTTAAEHNAVLRPLRAMADRGFVDVTWLDTDGRGYVDPQAVAQAITPSTRLVAVTHASNVTGSIQPIETIGRIVREHDALFLVDAAQTAGVVDVSVKQMNIDLLAAPGHKALLGPMGTGVLCVGERVDPSPWREGGTGGDSAHPVQPPEYPYILEAGTPNAIGFAGLGAALDVITPAETLAHEQRLLARLIDGLADTPGVAIAGDPDPTRRVGTLSLTIASMAVDEAGAVLDESFDIAVRAGLHCAPLMHKLLGTFPAGTVRVSPGRYTTVEEIDRTVEAINKLATA
ncbi:MAG: aminotransferase class V-fold PLP-dependent enzyme [bacterium]|nr:aminotransferase class V-fold PLP-dependent enzyme [bacterium]